jgi:hypothetical protein
LDRELDDLVARLRQAPTPGTALEGFDSELRLRIDRHAASCRNRGPRLRLSFQVAAIAAAFVIGVVVGGWVPGTPHPTQPFLVDVMDP